MTHKSSRKLSNDPALQVERAAPAEIAPQMGDRAVPELRFQSVIYCVTFRWVFFKGFNCVNCFSKDLSASVDH